MEMMIKTGNQQTYCMWVKYINVCSISVLQGQQEEPLFFNNTDILVFKIGLFYKRKTWYNNIQQFKLVLFYTYPDTTIKKTTS